jgi:hypothetical protein
MLGKIQSGFIDIHAPEFREPVSGLHAELMVVFIAYLMRIHIKRAQPHLVFWTGYRLM